MPGPKIWSGYKSIASDYDERPSLTAECLISDTIWLLFNKLSPFSLHLFGFHTENNNKYSLNKFLFKMKIENLVVIQLSRTTFIRDIQTHVLSNLSCRDRKLELAGIIFPEGNPREEVLDLGRWGSSLAELTNGGLLESSCWMSCQNH